MQNIKCVIPDHAATSLTKVQPYENVDAPPANQSCDALPVPQQLRVCDLSQVPKVARVLMS
jgi:hypothetical protein